MLLLFSCVLQLDLKPLPFHSKACLDSVDILPPIAVSWMAKTVRLMPSQNQSVWTPHAVRGSRWCSGLTIKSSKCIPISQASRHVYSKTLPEESKNKRRSPWTSRRTRTRRKKTNKLCEMQNAARWIAHKAAICQCRWRHYTESKSCLSPVAEIKQTTVKMISCLVAT